MTYTVEIKPSGHVFTVEDDETVLDAALRQGFAMRYSCRGGACGACKGRLLSGSSHYRKEVLGLSKADQDQGFVLFCQAVADSDLVIEVKEIGAAKDIVAKTLPCRVQKMERKAPDVMRLLLKLPVNERLQFLAGQYIDILLPSGKRRSFSLANAPHNDAFLELHIRHIDGGEFTTQVFNDMQEKALLRFEGPLGMFSFNEDSNKPVILLAGGTGFAPVKAILEHIFAEGIERPVHFYWGARNKAGLYMDDWVQNYVYTQTGFKYTPVLSNAEAEDQWKGRTGFVHAAVIQDLKDLSGYEVYACGPPAMIDAARQDFVVAGLDEEDFFADAFTFASD